MPPATLAPPRQTPRRPVQVDRQQQRPLPARNESQLQFVERCHKTLRGSTDQKTRYALEAWSKSGRERNLQQIARQKFGNQKFVCVRNRPLFVEHSKTREICDPVTGQEREVVEHYDRHVLQGMVDRCNERILDTGDFAPLIEGHTPEREDRAKGAPMPDVLGYAGPFRVGLVGNVNPRWAIFADEWHHVEDAPRLRKLQRRSPEVWLEEKMSDRFMDPIACLGAETPRLDMGLTTFSRTSDGRLVQKYSAAAVAPSGSNTFLPSDHGERRRDHYDAGETDMLSPEEVKQIVDAIEQLDWVQGVRQMLDASSPDPGMGAPPDPGMDPAAGADPAMGADPGMDAGMDAGPPDQGMDVNTDTGAGPGFEEPGLPDQNAARYECDDDDRDMMSRYMSGEAEDEEVMEYMSGKRSRYMAEGTAEEGDIGDPPDNATVANQQVAGYSRSRSNGSRPDKAVQYARVARENAELKQRLSKLENASRENYRRRCLTEQSHNGVIFDLDDEMELTRGMSDKQFQLHVDRVMAKYERMPASHVHAPLYTPDEPLGERAKNDRYAKDRAEKIKSRVQREREKGNNVSWEEAAELVDAAG